MSTNVEREQAHHNEPEPESFPTPYVATIRKVMPSGHVTITGNSAATVAQAQANLEATRAEYYESGGWGGPG